MGAHRSCSYILWLYSTRVLSLECSSYFSLSRILLARVNEQPKQEAGCFVRGCLIALIFGLIAVVIVGGSTWYLYRKAVSTFTSNQKTEIRIEPPPSDDQFQSAEEPLGRFREAIRNNQEAVIEFSAADLNALVARDPNFLRQRGKVRFGIVDSIMTLDLSTSLDPVPLPGLHGRWFNGTVRLSFSYTLNEFVFDIKSAETNGHNVPEAILSPSFVHSFNNSFNRSFHNAMVREPQNNMFWERIKTITLQGEKLIVTTQAR
jgi:hypothetical protein